MTENTSQNNSPDYKAKELLYNLFYELTSEIKGCKIEIDEEEYDENVRNINFPQLINYVRDSIQILLKKKSDKEKQLESIDNNKIKVNSGDIIQYQSLLKKFEEKERKLLKRQFQHRLQREAMENKISEYMEMEEEFEEMKTKLKYEDGKFLTNDRKDNEIIIIRTENTNLKAAIAKLEETIKQMETTVKEKETELESLRQSNDDLQIKLEEKQKELNLFSNININISNCNTTKNQNEAKKEKCPYCSGESSVVSPKENPKESKSPNRFQKVIPNLLKKSTYLSQAPHNSSSNRMENTDRITGDFITKYFSNKHSKSKSQLNHSSIKITRLPFNNHSVTNKLKSQIPPISQNNISINGYSYKQLFHNNNLSTNSTNSHRKTNKTSNNSYRLGNGESY